ncbi:MAG: hypothetical protein U0517_03310 [Candidatus Andersenbacteria bacterium]
MPVLDRIRSLPLSTRRTLTGVIAIGLAAVAFGVWLSFDLSSSGSPSGLHAIGQGADSVAQLVQKQTDKYAETKKQLQDNLDQTLKSSALVLPESLSNVREEPDGVLFLQYEHRQNGTKTVLEDVTFYPSYTLVRATITNESETEQHIDTGHGSVLEQQAEVARLALQPIFQSGTPVTLKAGESVQAQILFGPVNGRLPFEVVIGDYALADTDQGTADQTWAAHFSVDPSKIVEQKP